ncbi:MAG: outer membrane lipoprotein-sorting protein [Lentisphaerae bacterium]|jgi:hypothetical protein|nr:outer membrane lipoprotein-sorting protein [Lentisphaerota bacterium]
MKAKTVAASWLIAFNVGALAQEPAAETPAPAQPAEMKPAETQPAEPKPAELTVEQIVNKANEVAYYAGDDGIAQVEMTITGKDGVERTRKFTILRKDFEGGDQKFYVYFKEPADLYKQIYRVWKKVGDDQQDERELFIPSLNKPRPIAPGDKRTSFAGSDFVYEDVSGRNLKEDQHELIETTETHYIIKNTPVKPDDVEFSYYTIKIDKTTFMPRLAEYYDKQGKLYRTVEGAKVETIKTFPTVTESVVKDLKSGSTTVNKFVSVEYDVGLNERIFEIGNDRFLNRPPREATR